MPPQITRKLLVDWAGEQVVRDAEILVERGQVLEASYEPPFLHGTVLRSNRPLRTRLRIVGDRTVDNLCPCWTNQERGLICPHVIALGVVIVRRATDPLREAKYREEQRRAARLARVDESDYLRRVPADTAGAVPAAVELVLPRQWPDDFQKGLISVNCRLRYQHQTVPLDGAPRDVAFALKHRDENLVFVLEDICEGPAAASADLSRADFLNVLRLCSKDTLQVEGGSRITIGDTPLSTYLRIDLDRESGELILAAHTEVPFLDPGNEPAHLVDGRSGWVYGANHLWPLANLLPLPYHGVYDNPVTIGRTDVLRFLHKELPLLTGHARVESDISTDLFSADPTVPSFRLLLRGSPASLSATLSARYEGVELVAVKPDARGDFGFPDPEDIMRYFVRNLPAERAALALLTEAGLRGECGDDLTGVVGKREVLNFLGGHLPALRRRGWRIEVEGRISELVEQCGFAIPVVHVDDSPDGSWFDVGFSFEESSGASLSQADVRTAILKGDSYLMRNGSPLFIDSDAVEAMQEVFSDCSTSDGAHAGSFRMQSIYAPFVHSSLNALDGVDLEISHSWRNRAEQSNRSLTVEAVALPGNLETIVRPYQRDGVNWLRFLEQHTFCGLLADEMGLGKTLQALAWLQLTRLDEKARGLPALIVCPTSLVENWAEEAARFTPGLNVLVIQGPDRARKWERAPDHALVITSYALLRRDLDDCLQHNYSVLVLDEAQHIKNRATRNAVACKQVHAHHRLVLTGTPVENSVSDLWSIMDFLMPGYLSNHDLFRKNYELPIRHGGTDAELAQLRLRRKLHPFLLRRLKREVAVDLPPRIQRIAYCSLTPDQKLVYSELLEASRRKISSMVDKQGFNRSRMQILAALMRLRQTCCHLDLLKLPSLAADKPSAKLDLFLELMDEALDSGHRVLVFSQFVTMLAILRTSLEERQLEYCYLDGSTKERQAEVHRFNTEPEIPAFLISLKAGGTGLNLTGADMVIHFDPWWNPAVEDQATDRAHRIGQTRTVYSVKLIARDTVEEKVLAMQKRKKEVINATVENDEQAMQNMTWNDISEILSL